jgi:hypothetical protein
MAIKNDMQTAGTPQESPAQNEVAERLGPHSDTFRLDLIPEDAGRGPYDAGYRSWLKTQK